MTKSIYSSDGSYRQISEELTTVGEVIEALRELPEDLPVHCSLDACVQLVWFNVGKDDEHLSFSDFYDEPKWELRQPS